MSIKAEGARSGTNVGHHQCEAPAGIDASHPPVPFDYNVGVGWFVVAGMAAVALVYLFIGTLVVPERGRVSH